MFCRGAVCGPPLGVGRMVWPGALADRLALLEGLEQNLASPDLAE
ncbi:hypothetical protein CORC01_02320 [Colletotrichum orchidophilum]|uniref:Uncharacterized protein n=1 Tax=Colletotrichum orchidophilum TaxID=1209926 RepID=A0A1G4BLZ4_9PEZI|nr:uncharacterized protein CORC01_02320 [Colletotrichum orchidophilum]OHF02327.1 hypothetical protein CORC01_02320 [Colletotrichum orchidophilum]